MNIHNKKREFKIADNTTLRPFHALCFTAVIINADLIVKTLTNASTKERIAEMELKSLMLLVALYINWLAASIVHEVNSKVKKKCYNRENCSGKKILKKIFVIVPLFVNQFQS